jgi:predicted nucleic acid-binding protein
MFLLDTNVICEMSKKRPSELVMRWIKRQNDIALASGTIQEIAFGIGIAPAAKQPLLKEWFQEVLSSPNVHVLAFDAQAAALAGNILASRQNKGSPISILDAQIAAVALRYGLALATRNTKDFAGLNVSLVNPFSK